MDIFFLLKAIWRKKLIWIIIPLLAGAAAFLFTLNHAESYLASAQLATGFTMNDQVQLTDERFNPRDADIKFSNLLSSMNSSVSANFISYRLLLHDLDEANQPFRIPSSEKFQTNESEITEVRNLIKVNLDSLLPLATSSPNYPIIRKFLSAYGYDFVAIKSSLSIKRMPNTDFIQVDYVSENPELSALAANAFCEEFIRYSKSLKNERAGESVDFLTELVAKKKVDLDEKLETQRLFKSSNNTFSVEQEGGNALLQLSDFEKQRDDIKSNLQRVELTRDKWNRQLNGLSSPSGNTDNTKILELRNRINRMNERYISGGGTNNALRDSIGQLREQLRVQTENIGYDPAGTSTLTKIEIESKINDLDVEYQVLRSTLNTVEARIRSLQYSFSGYASKEAKLGAIQQEVDLASQEYLEAVAKFNEARNNLISSNTLRQIVLASPALYPLNSKRILIVGIAMFSSFSLCLFVIVLFEILDQSIRSVDKFTSLVNLPLIGSVIKIKTKNLNIQTLFNRTADQDAELYKSSLRKIRHEIVSTNSKVFLVTSLRKNEGKSFIIIALSFVLSLIDKRVLIVDTNFRNNYLSSSLPKSTSKLKVIEDSKPIALLTTGSHDNDADEFKDSNELVSPTIFKNIFIVTNLGAGVASPAEILSGRNFDKLILNFREEYDYIFLEGGALNEYSDTKELVPYVDRVVTIFSAQATIGQQDRDSIQYISTLGDQFGGCILNRIDAKDYKS